jgi:peptide methionine sulfoxide reductase msrA/msrB
MKIKSTNFKLIISMLAVLVSTLLFKGKVMAEESNLKEAIFGGGCFWCMQPPYDKLKGVKKTYVGYSGGHTENPTYEEVASRTTGHVESVLVVYDPREVSYTELLNTFWKNIDPTQEDGQFADKGSEYRTVIFYGNEEEKKLAEESKKTLGDSGKFKKPIATAIEPASVFYRAEENHQEYYKKNAVHYKLYKMGSGREAFIKSQWGE